MTFSQLEYIIALDRYRHFGNAAKKCFITQPSLSMQLQNLEAELGVEIFCRSQPVSPTEIGSLIIEQAKKIVAETLLIPEIIQQHTTTATGTLRIGIIPTLAPYLLPLFLQSFIRRYPGVQVSISELTTTKIIKRLKNGSLDVGLMATPLHEKELLEEPLFTEEFVAYVSKKDALYKKKYLLPGDIDINRLWLLEEGHCLRAQVMNLCELQKDSVFEKHLDYETGSIETLKRFVDYNQGITLLPELATLDMTASKKQMLRYFKAPAPAREISIVTMKSFIKRKFISLLKEEIIAALPVSFSKTKKQQLIAVH